MNFEPRNLFITGGAGFIGSNFVHHWLANTRHGRVVVFDALTYAGNIDNLSDVANNPRYAFIKGDICDEANVRVLLEAHQIDTLVHFAAESHVDRSILGPDDFIRTNVIGTHSLLKAAKSSWIDRKAVPDHRFHHISSDEVYGSLRSDQPPFREDSPYAPNSPYSATKAASDHLVRAYHETYGLKTTVTNCSNNYGPYHFPEKLIPLTIVNILAGKSISVYGDGRQVRDWLHVEDHCAAISLALMRGRAGEVYNIGGSCEMANIDLVLALCELVDAEFSADPNLRVAYPAWPGTAGTDSKLLITHVKDRPGHDRRYAIDFRKAREHLGYVPERELTQGLRDTVRWFLANSAWWLPLLRRTDARSVAGISTDSDRVV
jgi:dTDP-glucose 4,6-dehydratase